MELVLLLATYLAPDPAKLGVDDWEAREAAQARYSNVFHALLLPTFHPDPEVNYRLRAIKARGLCRLASAEFVERAVYRGDFGRWLDRYFIPDRSCITDEEAREEMVRNGEKMVGLQDRWPMPLDGDGGQRWSVWYPHQWCEYRDYHRLRIPAPREK